MPVRRDSSAQVASIRLFFLLDRCFFVCLFCFVCLLLLVVDPLAPFWTVPNYGTKLLIGIGDSKCNRAQTERASNAKNWIGVSFQ